MGKTVIEKIVEHNTGKSVKPGDIAIVNVDRVMIHDIFIPFVAEKFEEMGFKKLWDPDKVVLIYDHLVPASQQDDTRHFRIGNAFAEKYGMTHVHRSRICKAGRYRIRYRQPHNDLRLRRRILFRDRIYRDGKYLRNRYHVDPRTGDDQGRHQRKTAGERDVKGHYSPSHR